MELDLSTPKHRVKGYNAPYLCPSGPAGPVEYKGRSDVAAASRFPQGQFDFER